MSGVLEVQQQCCAAKRIIACDDEHQCSRHDCNIERVAVTVLKHAAAYHFCTIHCPLRPHDASSVAVGKMSNVFFCTDSGQVHRCSKACIQGETEEIERGVRLCCVSGIVYGQEEVSLYKTQRSFRNVRLYCDPYSKHRGSSKQLSSVPQFESALRFQAMEVVRLLLFSNRRAYAERRKTLLSIAAAQKRLSSHTKQCHSVHQPVVFTHLVCIALHCGRKTHWKRPSASARSRIEQKCSDVVVNVWTVLRKHTVLRDRAHFGRMLPTLVASILYLMKSGLPMNNVQIIPKMFFLEAALPEANTLHAYGIARGQFTSIKNDIRNAIREAIHCKRLNPRALAVHIE